MFTKNVIDQKMEENILNILETIALTDPKDDRMDDLLGRLATMREIENDRLKIEKTHGIDKNELVRSGTVLTGVYLIVNAQRIIPVISKALPILTKVIR